MNLISNKYCMESCRHRPSAGECTNFLFILTAYYSLLNLFRGLLNFFYYVPSKDD